MIKFAQVMISAYLLSSLGAEVGFAQESSQKTSSELGSITLKFENDLFKGTDHQYTNGIRASYLSPEGDEFEYLNFIRDGLELIATPTRYTRFGLALGQDMYTPEDRYETAVIEDDRPYAGWLYGGASLHTVRTDPKTPSLKTLESIELDVGVVGPASLAQEAQDIIHDLRNIDRFDGWDNQLGNELGVVLMYERKWRFADPVALVGSFEMDFIPYVGASIGNVLTHANVGGAMRLGWHIPEDFGPPSLIHGANPIDTRYDDEIGFYFYGTTELQAIAHNIFLDGNTLSDSHSVDKNNFVGDFVVGAVFQYKRFTLSYANAFRTEEFDTQNDPSRFGSITASFQALSW